jgi:MOSC domain-containing protein YiiM
MHGTVIGIHIAPGYGRPVEPVPEVEAVAGKGLRGDRYFGTRRQVTLVATGELHAAAAELGAGRIEHGATRRNITIDLPSLPRAHGTRIEIGETVLEVWRDCAPCEVMESAVGPGARVALRDRAGVSATVVEGGVIRIGDPVRLRQSG